MDLISPTVDRTRSAVHEAGHVIAYVCEVDKPNICQITVFCNGAGVMKYDDELPDQEDSPIIIIAGAVSEWLEFGNVCFEGYDYDLNRLHGTINPSFRRHWFRSPTADELELSTLLQADPVAVVDVIERIKANEEIVKWFVAMVGSGKAQFTMEECCFISSCISVPDSHYVSTKFNLLRG